MISKKKKVFLIIIGLLLLIFFSPVFYFKSKINIKTQNSLNEKNINGSTTELKTLRKGISSDEKQTDLKNDSRIEITNSSELNFGIYSVLKKEITLNRIVSNEKIKTVVQAECDVWGLGKLSIKQNNFDEILKNRIDEIYTEN